MYENSPLVGFVPIAIEEAGPLLVLRSGFAAYRAVNDQP